MNTQETSAKSHREELENGRIKGNAQRVALAFAEHGPGTSAEILNTAKLDRNRNLMRARITELADLGVLQADGERACKITGKRCIVWRFAGVTGKPRVKVDKLGASRLLLTRILSLPHKINGIPYSGMIENAERSTEAQEEFDELRAEILAFLKGA